MIKIRRYGLPKKFIKYPDSFGVKNGIFIHLLRKINHRSLYFIIKGIIFFGLFILFFLNFSCEKEKKADVKTIIQTNRPPIINSVHIIPQNPNIENDLDVTIRSQDPDGDPITYHYQWIRNNEEISGENKNILKRGKFKKGDLIQIKIIPTDGKMEGKPFLSEPIKILNSSPVIQEVWIEPKIAFAQDRLKVHIKSEDIDGDSITYMYQWEKNKEILSEESSEILEKGRFKKGDSITVIVTPDDKEKLGIPKRSPPVVILNSPPIIVSSPPTSVEGSEYSYQVKAYDPDNDSIYFSLKSGPKGMTIDKETGLIRWNIQWKDRGTHLIEIEASDQDGAKSFQRFDLNVEVR